MIAAPGSTVRVRRRTWMVDDVEAYAGCGLLTLVRHSDDGARVVQRVLHPFDDVEVIERRVQPARVSLRAWRAACRARLSDTGTATSLRCAARARIELLPFQFEPALALLEGRGVRLLLADDVGLGKTVQALLVAAELRARGAADRVLVLCPAGLRDQWATESAERFGLEPLVFDHQAVRRVRAVVPSTVNPWTTAPFVIASIDYVKRPEVLPAVLGGWWDLVVLDEAHGVCGASDRHHAAAALARRATYVVLLTATPHNGDDTAFRSLCALGQVDDDPLVVIRRTRADTGERAGPAADAGRRVHPVRVTLTPGERRMHEALAHFTETVRSQGAGIERGVWLLLTLLHKRAFSSAFALAESVQRRLALLDGRGGDPPTGVSAGAAEQLGLPLGCDDGEDDTGDRAPMWEGPALHDGRRERDLLSALLDRARAAEGDGEAKLRRLRRLLDALHEPAIVFTEYRDTLLHLCRHLGRRAAVLHGGLDRGQRHEALRQFADVGLLLATDAAGEGLNLQQHCRVVVNLELPWNPMRLEQRIGRVDRIGQSRRVHAFHLVAHRTGEQRMLGRLAGRVSRARRHLMDAPDPLSERACLTEEQAARCAVLGETPDDTVLDGLAPRVQLTRLREAADVESARIRLMRALDGQASRRPQRPLAGGPLMAVSRRHATRRALHGSALAIFRSTIADRAGRPIASRVDALLLPRSAGTLADALADAAHATRIAAHAASRSGWVQTAVAAHTRLIDVRLKRLGSVQDHLARQRSELQCGLFERRAERAWQQECDEHEAAVSVLTDRITRAAASRVVQVSEPALDLLLLPATPESGR